MQHNAALGGSSGWLRYKPINQIHVILQNEQVRTDLSMLPSACFEVLVNADGQIVLRGGGNGHGIGMSQYGARGMAEKGYNYKEILDYYYDNVVIKKL